MVIAHNTKAIDLHFFIKQSYPEMESRTHYERNENYVLAEGASLVLGQHFFANLRVT